MAIDGFTVNGPALFYTGTGAVGALELLGYTENGVDVRITEHSEPVMTDIFGTQIPHDFQDMGMSAEVRVPLIAMDRTVFLKVIGKGDRTTVGLLNTPGMLKGQGGHAFRIGIAAPADSPWSFTKAILRPDTQLRLATKAHPLVLTFFAIPFSAYTVTAGKDTSLWTRTLA